KCGIKSLAEMKGKPLKISVREDPTHSTHVLVEQVLSLHGFTLKDVESWGGKLVLCGGPGDVRRLDPVAKGQIDMIFDEGIKTWLPQSIAAGKMGVKQNHDCIDFSGWPIYCSANLDEKTVYDVCGAIAAREFEMPF